MSRCPLAVNCPAMLSKKSPVEREVAYVARSAWRATNSIVSPRINTLHHGEVVWVRRLFLSKHRFFAIQLLESLVVKPIMESIMAPSERLILLTYL